MSSMFSAHWYRVADLHPRIRSHVQVDRHCYRGEVWHVLKDPLTGRNHRLNAIAYRIVGRLDGRLSLQQIWDLALEELGEEAPGQNEVIGILSQLHEAELISTEAATDVADLFVRRDRRERRQRSQRANPLAFRVPLLDPSGLLNALAPLAAALSRPWVSLAWFVCVALGALTAATHWRELGAYAALNLATPGMLLTLWLCYPVIKAFHELAHALAVRLGGGEVREVGVTLLVLTPVPYVDASAASGFRSKGRRIVVSLIGIAAELLLAAIAAFVWANAGDGAVRQIAFATMAIGGVSTLLFNGNPLMRFDAYYALSDALEIPGLAARSNAWLAWLAERHLLGGRSAPPPTVGHGERRWLIAYGLASGAYRWAIAIAIVLWLAQISLALGVVVAAWTAWRMLLSPAVRVVRHVLHSPSLDASRHRAISVASAGMVIALFVLFAVPVPHSTRAHGVVWLPEEARIRVQGDGFVERVLARDGEAVEAGQPVLQLREPQLVAEWAKVRARLAALDAAYQAALGQNAAEARRVAEDIARARGDLETVVQRMARLTVRSGAAGTLSLPLAQDLPGAFLAKGSLVAHSLSEEAVRVRVALAQTDVALVRDRTRAVEVRMADAPERVLPATLGAQTPAATHELPSAALGDRGGGPFDTDPADAEGTRSITPVFVVDLKVPAHMLERIGGRVWVRFDHGAEPIATQGWRRLQQVFLRLLGGDRAQPVQRA